MKKTIISIGILLILIGCNPSKHEISNQNNTAKTKFLVAVFNGNGASPTCVEETYESLKIDSGISPRYLTAAEILSGVLDSVDVIIFPGGSASQELNHLGQIAAEKVKQFIKNGGGIVGICAGAYLLTTSKGYPSLEIVSATQWDREHYDRGRALVEFKLSKTGLEIFPELINQKTFLQYFDGPVLFPSDSGRSGKIVYQEMAQYVSDIKIHENHPVGITPGKTFLLGETIGNGRAMAIAGHPEATPGMRWMVPRMARWTAKKELINYPAKWIKPYLYKEAIFYTKELTKLEKKYFWDLFSDNDSIKYAAMNNLHDIKSRPAVRWNVGLLRDSNAKIRIHAAELLAADEYTIASKDFIASLKTEKDPFVKKTFADILQKLTY